MSDLTPQAAALLQRARKLLEPEPEKLAAVRGSLARKLEAGASPSSGELDALGRTGLAPRGLWTMGGKLGVAAGLTLLAGAGVLVLRATPQAAVPSATAPPPAAHERGPSSAADAPAVLVMERAAPNTAPQARAPEPPAAIAARPARTSNSGRPSATAAPELSRSAPHTGHQLARAASARGARRAPTAQLALGSEPTLASADPSTAASRKATPYLAAGSGRDQNAAATARPAATPPVRPPATPAAEGARVAAEQPRSARAADEERLPGVRDRLSGEQQRPSGARVPERDLLAREVAMLDGARAALERGDDARALQILDAHAREFPAGGLSEEQLALRARALCALGRIDEGRRAVKRLAVRAPESPHLKRSQAACGIAE